MLAVKQEQINAFLKRNANKNPEILSWVKKNPVALAIVTNTFSKTFGSKSSCGFAADKNVAEFYRVQNLYKSSEVLQESIKNYGMKYAAKTILENSASPKLRSSIFTIANIQSYIKFSLDYLDSDLPEIVKYYCNQYRSDQETPVILVDNQEYYYSYAHCIIGVFLKSKRKMKLLFHRPAKMKARIKKILRNKMSDDYFILTVKGYEKVIGAACELPCVETEFFITRKDKHYNVHDAITGTLIYSGVDRETKKKAIENAKLRVTRIMSYHNNQTGQRYTVQDYYTSVYAWCVNKQISPRYNRDSVK